MSQHSSYIQNPAERLAEGTVAPLAPRTITWRGILIGLLLLPPNALVQYGMENIRGNNHPTYMTIFANVVFALLVVLLVNAFFRRFLRCSLGRGDLLVIYMMLNIGAAMVSFDMVGMGISHVMYPSSNAEQNIKDLWQRYLPSWMAVHGTETEKAWNIGHANMWNLAVWRPWLPPLAGFMVMLIPLLTLMMSIAALLRKQWAEREKLSFPLTWLPIEMTREDSGLFRNKLMWIGFSVSALLVINNAVSYCTLINPAINLELYFGDVNKRNWMPLTFYPFAVGIGFLMPVDLLFSCTFFFWFWKLVLLVYDPIGDIAPPAYHPEGAPYIFQQVIGASYFIFLWVLWNARQHLKKALLAAWHGASSEDVNEPLRYRWAIAGIVGSLVCWFIFWNAVGMDLWVSCLAVLMYVALATVVTRLRAELGPPFHEFGWAGADQLLPKFFGVRGLGIKNVVVLNSFFRTFTRAMRPLPMPFHMESFQIAKATRIPMRLTVAPLMIAGVVGTAVALWTAVFLVSQGRGANNGGWLMETAGRLGYHLQASQNPDIGATIGLAVGFLSAAVLSYVRVLWVGFPLSPIGYILSTSWTYHMLWFPLAIALVIKGIILRYSGLAGMRKAMPFFLGLILGEFGPRTALAIIELCLGQQLTYGRDL